MALDLIRTMKRKLRKYGTLVPELERFQCSSCKAEFFDDAAMKTIEEFRQRLSQKRALKRSKKRIKAVTQ
jgi:hypothetical protein